MLELTVVEVAEITGAKISIAGGQHTAAVIERLVVTDVTTDSRAVTPGCLFVALEGERADGHEYVGQAWSGGAVAVLTRRPVDDDPGNRSPQLCLVVPDPLIALGQLAKAVVRRAAGQGLRTVAITGSQGKTSVKDLLGHLLGTVGATVAPLGNLNNELGLPLTVFRIEPETEFFVAEMGARGMGHIAYLCDIAQPQVGVVLNVGQAHIGEFGSREAIAQAKGEMVESLSPRGTAVLNADDPLVWLMRSRTQASPLAFSVQGEPEAAQAVWAGDITTDAFGRCAFRLSAKSTTHWDPTSRRQDSRPDPASGIRVQLQLVGRHQVSNAVAAAAAAIALGVPLPRVAQALSGATAQSRWRMEVTHRPDGVTIINDAYNANPDSVLAALDALAELGHRAPDGHGAARPKTWAVLGDMLELGRDAAAEHRRIGVAVAQLQIDSLVAIGTFASDLVNGAVERGLNPTNAYLVPDKRAAADLVAQALRPGDVVLVKASRGLALETVAEDLLGAVDHSPGPSADEPSEESA